MRGAILFTQGLYQCLKSILLNPNPTFNATVKFAIPGEQTASIKLEFKHKNSDDVKDFIERVKEMEDFEAISEIVTGWDIGEPFNEENLKTLLSNYGGAARAIVNTYWREIFGAREGN